MREAAVAGGRGWELLQRLEVFGELLPLLLFEQEFAGRGVGEVVSISARMAGSMGWSSGLGAGLCAVLRWRGARCSGLGSCGLVARRRGTGLVFIDRLRTGQGAEGVGGGGGGRGLTSRAR